MNHISQYTDFLSSHANIKRPLNIVCDSSNGATGQILKDLLLKLNLKSFKIINSEPDPEFKAHGPNPLIKGAINELAKEVVDSGADLGAIFDGDGDRVFFVDNEGKTIPSYVVSALIFQSSKPPYVADEILYQTLMYSKIFSEKELIPSRIGQSFIRKTMKENNAESAAEFSGHFNHRDFFNVDSGLFTMVKFLSIISNQEKSLSDVEKTFPIHKIDNVDINISGKDVTQIEKKIEEDLGSAARSERRDGISIIFNDGWANVRASNTEPLIKIYAGSNSTEKTAEIIEKIKSIITQFT